MTDMTPEEINKMIAEWVGWTNVKQSRMYQGRLMGNMPERYEMMVIPDYYRSNAAMDLLGVLVERGYKPELSYHNLNWWHKLSLPGYKQPEYYAIKPTIPAAICTAIIELIEREGKEVMDTSIKAPEERPEKKIVGWECSSDGKHFARFATKRCRYCLPIYEGDKEVAE